MDRRSQILAVAERLLERYGPGKTTMADIAREAGLGVGTVYLEFHSKDDIVAALSQGRHEQVLTAMREVTTHSHCDFASRLRAMIDAKISVLWRLSETGAHAADLVHCGQSAVQQEHSRFLRQEHDLVEALITAAITAGEFARVDPDTAATAVLTAYGSFAPPRLFCVCRDETARRLEAMHALVLDGLRAR